MSVSTMDTAEVPRSGARSPAGTVMEPAASPSEMPDEEAEAPDQAKVTAAAAVDREALRAALVHVVAAPAPAPIPVGRSTLRRERRQHRRQQRLFAAAGLAVLAAVFLLTVFVLGGIR